MTRKRCKLEHRKRNRAYGEQYSRGNWCIICDKHFAPDINKKRARQRAKQHIRRELSESRG